MIVRILGEGRYDVPEGDLPVIEQLDEQLNDAIELHDAERFSTTLNDLIQQIRHDGAPVADDDLSTSELVVPHEGSSLDEVKALLADEP